LHPWTASVVRDLTVDAFYYTRPREFAAAPFSGNWSMV
jgi:hypothetical protein